MDRTIQHRPMKTTPLICWKMTYIKQRYLHGFFDLFGSVDDQTGPSKSCPVRIANGPSEMFIKFCKCDKKRRLDCGTGVCTVQEWRHKIVVLFCCSIFLS